MVIREKYMIRTDGVVLYRSYSDAGLKIVQNETGKVYDEAIDVEDAGFTYSETDIPSESDEITAEEALDIIVNGGGGNA